MPAEGGTGGGLSPSGVVSDCVDEGVVEDKNETGLALTVGQSEAADTGLSLREVELVSDICGEYFLWSGLFTSILRTKFALLAGTTFAVFITGDPRARTGVAGTKPSSVDRATAVDGYGGGGGRSPT